MNKWVSLYGNFEPRDENIIFNGQEFRNVTGERQPLVGEILLEDKMLSGAVSVDIEFSMYIAKLLCAKFEIFRYSWLIE